MDTCIEKHEDRRKIVVCVNLNACIHRHVRMHGGKDVNINGYIFLHIHTHSCTCRPINDQIYRFINEYFCNCKDGSM